MAVHIEGLGKGLQKVAAPDWLAGVVTIAGIQINAYRGFIIVLTAALTAATWLLLYRTALGIQIRAIMRNPKMAAAISPDN